MNRIFKILGLGVLLWAHTARAADSYTAYLYVTNAPSQLMTLVVNGDTRTWKTNATAASHISLNPSGSNSENTTNLFSNIVGYPFTGPLYASQTSTNQIRLIGGVGQALSITMSNAWGYFTITTNAATSMVGVRVPISGEPTASSRTNIASQVVDGINTYSTNRFGFGVMPTGVVTGITGSADINIATASGISTLSISNSSALKALTINNASALTNLNASSLASGTVPDARLSGNVSLLGSLIQLGTESDLNGGSITNLNATQLLSGTVPDARLSANVSLLGSLIQIGTESDLNGGSVTNLNATQLLSGTVPDARLSGNVSLLGSLINLATESDNNAGSLTNFPSSVVLTTGNQTIAGVKTFSNNIVGSGTDNTLNNQTLTGNGSVMTRTLADTRYLSTYSPLTYSLVQSGDSVSLTNSSIGLGMIYGASANIANAPTTTNQWLKSVVIVVQDAGTFIQSNGITNMSLRVRCTLNDNTIITIQDWVNANVFRGGGSFNQFSGKWFFTNETVWVTNANAYQLRHEVRFEGIVSNVTARLPSIATWYTTYPY